MTQEDIEKILKEEGLNESYIPNRADVVRPLPYTSSNKTNWTFGVVITVYPEGPTPECVIITDTGHRIVEYCNSILPVLNAEDKDLIVNEKNNTITKTAKFGIKQGVII